MFSFFPLFAGDQFYQLSTPSLRHVIPRGDGHVIGVTPVDGLLLVVRWPSRQRLEVYDAETFAFDRPLLIDGLGSRPGGLTSCPASHCVYVSDMIHRIVPRVKLDLSTESRATLTQWTVDGGLPTGLSVNEASDVLVTCRGCPHKIQEYTSDGILIREVGLPADMIRPIHAACATANCLVITSGGTLPGQFGRCETDLHRVSVISGEGGVLCSYGSTSGTHEGELDEPMTLTFDVRGRILVADKRNNRVVVLDSSLSALGQLNLSISGGLKRPVALWLDKGRGRLFVGEGTGGRVLIFDNVFDA